LTLSLLKYRTVPSKFVVVQEQSPVHTGCLDTKTNIRHLPVFLKPNKQPTIIRKFRLWIYPKHWHCKK